MTMLSNTISFFLGGGVMELVGILIGHMYFFLMFKVRPTNIEEGRGQCIHSSSTLLAVKYLEPLMVNIR